MKILSDLFRVFTPIALAEGFVGAPPPPPSKPGFDMKVRAFASKKFSSVLFGKVRRMASVVYITLILLLQQGSWVIGVRVKCEQEAALSRILENNEPQALVLPAGDEANSFISTQIRVR